MSALLKPRPQPARLLTWSWPEILEGDEAVITLDELGVRLSFQEIYDRVDWTAVEAG